MGYLTSRQDLYFVCYSSLSKNFIIDLSSEKVKKKGKNFPITYYLVALEVGLLTSCCLGIWVHASPFPSTPVFSRGGAKTRHKRVAEIKPTL